MKSKIIITTCLLGILVLLPIAGQSVDKPVYSVITIPVFYEPIIPRDINLINDKINEITRKEIGAEVKLIPLLNLSGSDPRRLAELRTLSAEGVYFDLVITDRMSEELLPMDDLLDKHGTGIKEVLGSNIINAANQGGRVYKLPTKGDYVSSAGVVIRKDIVNKYGIDLSNVRSFQDLDALFEYISEREPALKMICGYKTTASFLFRFKHAMLTKDSLFAFSSDDPTKLIFFYDSPWYKETITLFREWHQKGYTLSDPPIQSIGASQYVKAGELFAYFSAWKPGIEHEESLNSGYEMICIPLIDPVVTQRSVSLHNWGISNNSSNPGKAMKFLNLLYTNHEVVNLLAYGVQDIHYVYDSNGTITFPIGINEDTSGYINKLTWLLPNQTISHVWEGNAPDLWQLTNQFNDSAKISETLDFYITDSTLLMKMASLQSIIEKYNYGLETGQIDPNIYLPIMIDELKNAGAEEVLVETQKFYDDWIKVKGEE